MNRAIKITCTRKASVTSNILHPRRICPNVHFFTQKQLGVWGIVPSVWFCRHVLITTNKAVKKKKKEPAVVFSWLATNGLCPVTMKAD